VTVTEAVTVIEAVAVTVTEVVMEAEGTSWVHVPWQRYLYRWDRR